MNNVQIGVGQIWYQLALSNPDEPDSPGVRNLLILGAKEQILQTIRVNDADFKKQYVKYTDQPQAWKRCIRITSVDSSKVWFSRLDTRRDSYIDNISCKKESFLQDFLPEPANS